MHFSKLLPLIFGSLVSSLLFVSCKKESTDVYPDFENADTAFPGRYMPYYPNSWWKYVDRSGDTVVKRSSSSYMRHELITREGDHDYHYAVISPVYEGELFLGYQKVIPDGIYANLQTIFMETLGTTYIVEEYGYRSGPPVIYWQYDFTPSLSLSVNSVLYTNVVKVQSSYHNYQSPVKIWIDYYAPDVGLIESTHDFPNDTLGFVKILTLIDYEIGPH